MATKIRGAQINDAIAGAGLELTASGILNILVDNSSIEVYGDTLQVKSGGITNAMLANDSVTVTAGNALTGGGEVDLGGTAITLDVAVDGTTISTAGDYLSVIASGIDHGSISGLADDDHTQYILADGTRAFTGVFESVGMELTEGDVKLFSAPADSDVSGITASGTTSATFGQAVYVDASGNYVAAKADAGTTMPAVALSTGAGNEVITQGFITDSGWSWTPGGLIYVSDGTAGDLTQTAPTASGSQVQVVGVATSATTMYLDPDLTFMELGDPPYYTKSELTTSGVLDVRYYTETEVDAMISGAVASGVLDHGNLAGLADDDHTQYVLADGTREMTGDWNMGDFKVGLGTVPTYELHHVDSIDVTGAGGWSSSEYVDVTLTGDGTGENAAATAMDVIVTVVSGVDYYGRAETVEQSSGDLSLLAGYSMSVGVSGDTSNYVAAIEGLIDISDGTSNKAIGLDGWVGVAGGSLTEAIGVRSTLQHAGGSTTTAALFKGDYVNLTAAPTTRYGLYLDNEDQNYLSGTLQLNIPAASSGTGFVLVDDGSIIKSRTAAEIANEIQGSVDHGSLAGLEGDDHPQYLLVTSGTRTLLADLLPNASGTIDLGSAAAPYAEIHVDDIYVKGASIHLGGYAISEFSNDETLADASTSALPTEYAVKTYVTTVSGDLADYVDNEIVWEVVDTPTNRIQPKAAHMGLPVYIADSLTVGGNLTVTGTTFYTETEEVLVSDNFIYINYGEPGSGVTSVTAGIDVDRGGMPDYVFAFDERNDTFRIGVSGSQDAFNDYPLQPVATREDTPIDTRVPWWDAASYTFRTQGSSSITITSGTGQIYVTATGILAANVGGIESLVFTDTTQRIGTDGTTYITLDQSADSIAAGVQGVGSVFSLSSTGAYRLGKYSQIDINNSAQTITHTITGNGAQLTISGSAGIKLAQSTVYVNEILNTVDADSISASSTDAQLATAKLIYDYVDTISGAMVHNELEGLQGGLSGAYYHLGATAFTALSGVDGTDISNWDTAYSHTLLTNNPHSVTYSQVGAIQDSTDTVYDTHINWGTGANQVDLDDVPDGATYERVLGTQLNSGIYIDATDSVKGIASFSTDNFLVTSGVVTVKDDGIAEPELVIANAPTDGYYLQYTTASGMKWTDVSTEGVLESDFQLDNMSAECDGVETIFYLSYIPVANSLQVYLNGLLQEKGGGKDYTNTTSGVTFTTAPLTGDILIANYVRTSA